MEKKTAKTKVFFIENSMFTSYKKKRTVRRTPDSCQKNPFATALSFKLIIVFLMTYLLGFEKNKETTPMFLLKKTHTEKPRSFFCLNAAQFLGALNDNIYKLLTIFLLISTLGVEQSSSILSAVGAIYVIPFLLFSSAGGVLADKVSKQKLIVGLKGAEIVLMLLAIVVFYFKSVWGSYLLLFFLATHSAVFGPSKYGIIAELVEKQGIPKANGLVTALTYLAVIFGTFLASFFTDITGQNFVLCVSFCLVFAVIGFLFSLGIKKTTAQNSLKKLRFFFIKEIVSTIAECRKTPLLAPSLFGSAFFLFMGAFTQLNIIPFAMKSLHLSEYAGGYLFLLAALGIVTGSFLAGKFLKKKTSLGLSCLMGFIMSFLFVGLWIFSAFLIPTALFLILLGLSGGIFIISFDSFIQMNAPSEGRGQTIAAANFLSFLGVLVASFCLYLFGHVMGLSPSLGFLCMGILTFICMYVLSCRLLSTVFPFLSKLYYSPKNTSEFETTKIFLAKSFQKQLFLRAIGLSSSCTIVIQKQRYIKIPLYLKLAPNVLILPENISLEEALEKTKKYRLEGTQAYLFHADAAEIERFPQKKTLFSFHGEEVCFISLQKINGKYTLYTEKHFVIT